MQWKESGRLPPVLWQHRSGEPIGPFVEMAEDGVGLRVKGQLLVDDVQRAKEARALMKPRPSTACRSASSRARTRSIA
jgi:hypothetical protein